MTKRRFKDFKIDWLIQPVKKGLKKFRNPTMEELIHANPDEAAYLLFKTYYDLAEKPFSKEDAKELRINMNLFARKLYELHLRRVDGVEEK